MRQRIRYRIDRFLLAAAEHKTGGQERGACTQQWQRGGNPPMARAIDPGVFNVKELLPPAQPLHRCTPAPG